jgi:MinD-like ATPase involved in chromosome partitioning or flagellar assembly
VTAVLVAVDGDRGAELAGQVRRAGNEVVGVVSSHAVGAARDRQSMTLLRAAEVVLLEAHRRSLTVAAVAACDAAGVRILPLCATVDDERRAVAFGTAPPLPLDAEPWTIVDALGAAPTGTVHGASGLGVTEGVAGGDLHGTENPRGRIVAVWGAAGSPGRSTLAIELAAELARGGCAAALVDADSHASSVALALGIADEGPGFAAACRAAERGVLDADELDRISTPVRIGDARVDVLAGINRPSRWPELTDARVTAALTVCREWAAHTVVDVSSSLERDEEIVSDLYEGPRRNAATLAVLRAADVVVAVLSADPVGVARFLRAHAELRSTIGATRVVVVANRLRPGALGIDARGQVRRTLERFAGVSDIWFVPYDARSVDAALLAARPVAEAAPRSPMTVAVRRLVGEAITPPPAADRRQRTQSRRRRAVDEPSPVG